MTASLPAGRCHWGLGRVTPRDIAHEVASSLNIMFAALQERLREGSPFKPPLSATGRVLNRNMTFQFARTYVQPVSMITRGRDFLRPHAHCMTHIFVLYGLDLLPFPCDGITLFWSLRDQYRDAFPLLSPVTKIAVSSGPLLIRLPGVLRMTRSSKVITIQILEYQGRLIKILEGFVDRAQSHRVWRTGLYHFSVSQRLRKTVHNSLPSPAKFKPCQALITPARDPRCMASMLVCLESTWEVPVRTTACFRASPPLPLSLELLRHPVGVPWDALSIPFFGFKILLTWRLIPCFPFVIAIS